MRSSVFVPLIAGAITGFLVFAVSIYFPTLALCVVAFFIAGILMAVLAPLNSGPSFGGWIKASTTAISGMKSDIQYRGREGISGKMGAIFYFSMMLFVYFLMHMLLST